MTDDYLLSSMQNKLQSVPIDKSKVAMRVPSNGSLGFEDENFVMINQLRNALFKKNKQCEELLTMLKISRDKLEEVEKEAHKLRLKDR